MRKFKNILVKVSVILVIAGMFSHELVSHHHHDIVGEVHSCCDTDHESESNKKEQAPCTILSFIHFENYKPQIQVFSQELKHNHPHTFSALCSSCNIVAFVFTQTITRVFVPESVFSEISFYHSFSYRGPPLA